MNKITLNVTRDELLKLFVGMNLNEEFAKKNCKFESDRVAITDLKNKLQNIISGKGDL